MDKPISRKRALALYRDALERGDFDTVAAVLWLAERDPKLVHMIAKFHERADAPVAADAKPRRGIIEVVRINRNSSPNGWPPKPDQSEEEPNMFTTFVPARSPYYSDARKLRWSLIIGAAAILVVVALGLLLLYIRPPGATMPEYAAQPESCMAEGQNPQEESARLAGEAAGLLQAESKNIELSMLLSICALQTAYTPEADKALQLSLITAQAISEFPGNDTGILNSALFSPDGRYLLVSYRDGVRLWDIGAGTEIQSFLTTWGGPVALSPDGRYVLGTDQLNVAHLWDTETGAPVHDFNAGTEIIDLTFSPDGARIALGLVSGTVQIWRVDTATVERRVPLGYDIGDVAFSPDGTALLVSGDRNKPYSVHLLDVETGTELRVFTGLRDFANMAVFSPDGRYVLAGGDTGDRRALLWDAETGEELRVFSGYINDVNTVAFSPDSRYALVGSADSTVGLWDIETGIEVRRFGSVGSLGYVWSVGFSPDGKTILIGTSDGVVRLWPTAYHDMIALACQHVTRDFTAEERAQYGLGEGAACP
jgi:WD40 repeat protein